MKTTTSEDEAAAIVARVEALASAGTLATARPSTGRYAEAMALLMAVAADEQDADHEDAQRILTIARGDY